MGHTVARSSLWYHFAAHGCNICVKWALYYRFM